MKQIFILHAFVLSNIFLHAQDSFYEYVEIGNFNVGYSDTILYDDSLDYVYKDYSGKAPLFVQVWFPYLGKESEEKMTFGDFRKMLVPNELISVYKDLELKKDSASIWYHLENDFVKYQPIKYKKSHQEVLSRIKQLQTRTTEFKHILEGSGFPVVVYHHGAQGHSDENYVMAEYFASRGFIFIATNYHLPVEGKTYGSRIKSVMGYNKTSPKRILQFANNISSNKNVFFIGHSMGGQTGYSFLRSTDDVSAFVCMETTAEGRSQAKLQDMWKEMYATLKEDSLEYTLPILHIASMEREKRIDFYPFTMLHNAHTIFMQSKKPFGHESYTSSYMMRYLFRKEIKQPDIKAMKEQLELYTIHLKLILEYLQSFELNKEFDYTKYKEFYQSEAK